MYFTFLHIKLIPYNISTIQEFTTQFSEFLYTNEVDKIKAMQVI